MRLLVVVLISSFICISCGVKGPPLPPETQPVPVASPKPKPKPTPTPTPKAKR